MVRAGGAGAGKVSGSVTTGFDSFTEKYTIVEEDTLDRLTEFRTRLRLGYAHGTFLHDYLQLQGESVIGEESLESTARLNLLRRWGPSRFAVDTDLTFRTYRDSSEYSFPNDFLRFSLRAYARREIASGLSLRLTERLELLDFDERTEFDYDYVRNGVTVSGDLDRDLTTTYHASLSFTKKSIPDSTEIAYRAWSAAGDYRTTLDAHRHVYLNMTTERRLYAHEPTKSDFWALLSAVTLQPFARGDFGFGVENALESYLYDRESDAFFDYVENRSAFIVSYYRSFDLTFGLGPTAAFFSSDFSPEDEYTEFGAKATASYNAGTRIWLSASYEPGHRNYRVDGSEVIFSDFTYQRITLFATLKIWRGANLGVFLNHEPENHKIEGDDATATLFSLDLSYGF